MLVNTKPEVTTRENLNYREGQPESTPVDKSYFNELKKAFDVTLNSNSKGPFDMNTFNPWYQSHLSFIVFGLNMDSQNHLPEKYLHYCTVLKVLFEIKNMYPTEGCIQEFAKEGTRIGRSQPLLSYLCPQL